MTKPEAIKTILKRFTRSERIRIYLDKDIVNALVVAFEQTALCFDCEGSTFTPEVEKFISQEGMNRFNEFVNGFLRVEDPARSPYYALQITAVAVAYLKVSRLIEYLNLYKISYKKLGMTAEMFEELTYLMEIPLREFDWKRNTPSKGDIRYLEIGIRRLLSVEVGRDV